MACSEGFCPSGVPAGEMPVPRTALVVCAGDGGAQPAAAFQKHLLKMQMEGKLGEGPPPPRQPEDRKEAPAPWGRGVLSFAFGLFREKGQRQSQRLV